MKLKLEYQYFQGCPNHKRMSDSLNDAIKGLEDKIDLEKVLVENEDTAKKVSFRGSPTLLINGEDIEGLPAPEKPALACRFYVSGIPDSNKIRQIILQKMRKEK